MSPEAHVGKVFRNGEGEEVRVLRILDAPNGLKYEVELVGDSTLIRFGAILKYFVKDFDFEFEQIESEFELINIEADVWT
jgi:hypothetical protein